METAGVTPICPIAGRGAVVVRSGESPVHGEGPQEPSRNSELGDYTLAKARQISVPEMQKRLAEKATADPEHRFGNLYALLTQEIILDAAAQRLLANKGSRTAGLDGVDRKKLKEHYAYHAAMVRQLLLEGTFQPAPVKRVYIPKGNGKQRPLGIPTLYDRWVQMAIKLVLEPIFESDFSPFSHGFRPKRSCHTASAHLQKLTQARQRKVYWVIEGDIESFFDHVHHKKLMTLLRQRIRDKRMLDLIWSFLKAGVMEGELFKKTDEGTPQGGVLSPLLANIYLDRFDKWFAQRALLGNAKGRVRNRKAGHANFQMIRYADDFVVFSNGTKEETEAFKGEMRDWLAEELKLTLSDEKTKISHFTDGFDFLGFTFQKKAARVSGKEVVVSYPSTASVERAVRRIKALTRRDTLGHSPEDQIEALNAFLRGWGEYFRHSCASGALGYVGYRAHMQMWQWLNEKSGQQNGWRATYKRYYRDGVWTVGRHKLVKLGDMKIEYLYFRAIPNPYLSGESIRDQHHPDPYKSSWNGFDRYGEDWRSIKEEVAAQFGNKCVICGEPRVDYHHLKAKKKGGGNHLENLIPLCRKHHDEAEVRNSSVSHLLREIRLGSGEPDALKDARPVRGEGL
jgi:RNA-directed DNA polymerase